MNDNRQKTNKQMKKSPKNVPPSLFCQRTNKGAAYFIQQLLYSWQTTQKKNEGSTPSMLPQAAGNLDLTFPGPSGESQCCHRVGLKGIEQGARIFISLDSNKDPFSLQSQEKPLSILDVCFLSPLGWCRQRSSRQTVTRLSCPCWPGGFQWRLRGEPELPPLTSSNKSLLLEHHQCSQSEKSGFYVQEAVIKQLLHLSPLAQ